MKDAWARTYRLGATLLRMYGLKVASRAELANAWAAAKRRQQLLSLGVDRLAATEAPADPRPQWLEDWRAAFAHWWAFEDETPEEQKASDRMYALADQIQQTPATTIRGVEAQLTWLLEGYFNASPDSVEAATLQTIQSSLRALQ